MRVWIEKNSNVEKDCKDVKKKKNRRVEQQRLGWKKDYKNGKKNYKHGNRQKQDGKTVREWKETTRTENSF